MARRAYLRLDPDFFERKIVEDQYPHGAALALISTFCLAEDQPQRGRFRSEKLLRLLLDGPDRPTKLSRWVAYLIEHGDLVRQDKGVLYVDGWDEWQEGDWKVTERVQRIRAKPKVTPPVTVAVTPDVTPPVTPPRYSGSGGGRAEATAQAISGGVAPARDHGEGSKTLGARNRQPEYEERAKHLRALIADPATPADKRHMAESQLNAWKEAGYVAA